MISGRSVTRLRQGWLFQRGDIKGFAKADFIDSDWEPVVVPHDWAIKGPFGKGFDVSRSTVINDNHRETVEHHGRTGGLPLVGIGLYRTKFRLSATEARHSCRLEFDGVMSHSRVYVNGTLAGGRPYGYSSFCLDVSGLVKPGMNVLAVRAQNLPDSARWYSGAGIFRNVRLVKTSKTRIAWNGVWARSRPLDNGDAELSIAVEVEGGKSTVACTVFGPAGAVVGQAEATTGAIRLLLKKPALWSPWEPARHELLVELRKGRSLLDSVRVRFGIRSVRMDKDKGLFINGTPFRMNGVCLHHDLGPLGAAFSLPAARRQLRLLKSIGVNSLRTAHNPPDPQLLDLCDEMGILVIDEAFDCWQMGKTKGDYHLHFDAWHKRDLRDMIRRDRNHPCVILWSIGNEILEQGKPDGWKLAARLCEMVHDTDPDRPVTAGLSFGDGALDNGMAAVIDVPGWNYKPLRYGEYHARLPQLPQYASETSSTVSSRGCYLFPAEEGLATPVPSLQASSYDIQCPNWATTPDQEFNAQDKCPWIMGEFVWTGFDYLGEPSPYDAFWPAHSSYFGLFDLGGLPKDRAYLYRSRWLRNEPTLHLLPHWNWPGREGQITPVHCYTSFETVELFLNGKSLGCRSRNGAHRLVWNDVKYEAGELKAIARGKQGEALSVCHRRTAGPSARIGLSADTATLASDGEDLAFITVDILDASGEVVPGASDRVLFRIEGPGELAGLCNGDPTSLEAFDQNPIRTFSGRAVVIIRSRAGEAGRITLRAEACGLDSAAITLECRRGASLQGTQVAPIAAHRPRPRSMG
jgi:beta-galactosidase